jgi:aerobic carbon-monoxide dehydrogenase medium subunit
LKPPPFEYHAPESLDAALALLAEHGDEGKVLAGGQSLVPLLALRLARPAVLVDVGRVPELGRIESDEGRLAVGAMVRQRAAERSPFVRDQVPLLADALPLIGHLAIRSRGTVGGSIAHADPSAELPAVALATEAELLASSAARGERAIPASEFFGGFFTTALADDEILTSVRFPVTSPGTGTAFVEAARRHGDFAMVGAATMLALDGNRVTRARIVLTGVAGTPTRRPEAEALLEGSAPSDEAFRAAADAAATGLEPPSDLHGSSAYRTHVARVLVRRGLDAAARRAGGTS